MNRFTLKIIMVVFMLLDHIGYFIPGTPPEFRFVGRVVSPIFIFLMVEGFIYTKDRVAYLRRLVLGAQVMTIGNVLLTISVPYLLGSSQEYIVSLSSVVMACVFGGITVYTTYKNYKNNNLTDKNAIIYSAIMVGSNMSIMYGFNREINPLVNNIFLSMAISFIMLNGLEKLKGEEATTNDMTKIMVSLALGVFSEGALMIPAMAYIFYKYRSNKVKKYMIYALLCVLFIPSTSVEGLLRYPQWMMIFALVFMWIYNGKKGRDGKFGFYIFYPVHIWVLFIISFMIK